MSHRGAFEAVDKTLLDIRSDQSLHLLLLETSSRFYFLYHVGLGQTKSSPVRRLHTFGHTCTSYIYQQTLQGDQSAGQFAQHQLQLGNGEISTDANSPVTATDFSMTINASDVVYPEAL